jgi:cell shape-determining protein MreD
MPPIWELVKAGIGLIGVVALLWLGIAVDLAPLNTDAEAWPHPDLLFLLVACLVLRRPSLCPSVLVAAAGLLRDMLTGAAVGAGMLALLIAASLLCRVAPSLVTRSFPVEWIHVMLAAALAIFLPVPMLWLALSEGSSLGALSARWLTTVAAYPVVVVLLRIGRDERLRAGNLGSGVPS